jgi:recombination protein RecA
VKVVKNKVSAPFREAEFDIIFNEGISLMGEIIDLGVERGVVDKAGAWFSFRGERLGQGREGSKQFLRENPELAQEIRGLILDTAGIAADGAVAVMDDSSATAGESANSDEEDGASDKAKSRKKAAANG